MRRHAFLLLCLLAFPGVAAAAPIDPSSSHRVWAPVGGDPGAFARDGSVFAIDRGEMRTRLAKGTIRIPTPAGRLERFAVREDPVLTARLARRFPAIRTYTAEGIDDPAATARLDLTPLGFHAAVRDARATYYVDPRSRRESDVVVAYDRADLVPGETLREPAVVAERLAPTVAPARAAGEQVVRHTYRLALANDPSFAAFYGSTDEQVMAAKATIVNRVNQIFNDELAIRLELPYTLNFKTAAEYTAAGYPAGKCSENLIAANDAVLDRVIGSVNYDVGHLLGGSALNGGGIAGFAVVGTPDKGQGCVGLNQPAGDAFAVDFLSHELGHQFGAHHSFDGTGSSNCATNRTPASAVEPGSGNTVMAYAGSCGTDNLQSRADPIFSQQSRDEILGFVAASSAGVHQPVDNRTPTVTAPEDRTIPRRTPFALAGTGSDPDGDGLVYTWEQDDPGGATGLDLQSNSKTDGPLFRIFGTRAIASQNVPIEAGSVRSFPDAAQVAADNTNAETGTCANLDCFSEFLPTSLYAGPMHFRLTARDRDPSGGGVSHDDVTLALAGTEPFAVTGPTGPAAYAGGASVDVTWNVAGTDDPPVAAPDVRITYSTDGGLNFDRLVVLQTPNDGTETVTLPDVATDAGRFRVEAVGNYFFDVSDGNLIVGGATPTPSPSPSPSPSAAPTVEPVVPGGTPTPTPESTATATPTTTPVYALPTAAPTATATATTTALPGMAVLAPDLALVPRRLRPDTRGRVALRVRCKQVTPGVAPSRCRGRIKITLKGARSPVGVKSFTFGARRVGVVPVRLDRATRRRLQGRSLKAKVRATVGSRRATKKVRLRRTS